MFIGSTLLLAASAMADTEFNNDVLPLVADNCLVCHSDAGVSFSLEDPDTVYSLRQALTDAVANRRMPPWLAEPGHQEYRDDYSLTADEIAVFADWADAGYPRRGTASTKASVFIPEFDSDLTLAVLPDDQYLPNQSRKDDYRCFLLEWPYDEDVYVTGFKATPGNLKVAHHLVNFVVGPEGAEVLKAVSAEEEGPGHQCFGGPLPDRFGSEEARTELEARFPGGWDKLQQNFWLSHWAPGMYGLEFPAGTGIRVEPGSVVVVQMHYYSAFAPGEADSGTKMHFTIEDSVERPAVNHPLTNGRWLYAAGNESMQMAPGASEIYETRTNFQQIAKYVAHVSNFDQESLVALDVQSANVHMHAYGAAGRTSLVSPTGHKETLLAIPRWDLAWQRDFMFKNSKRVAAKDFDDTELVVECTYANYSDRDIVGGYGSDDEMCFNFSYISAVFADDEVVAKGR